MSFNNIKTKAQSERGFTIVELLIVIVVIGILAAITIVSFNGVTARANATSAKAAASSALKKAEAYNADATSTGYPIAPSNLTATAAQSTPYGLTGVTFPTVAFTAAPTTGPSTLNFYKCSGSTGVQVSYWDYTTSAIVAISTGVCTTPVFVAGP